MPVFMDLHTVPGAVLDDVVAAHKLDVAIQEQFGCNCMTFWFDQPRGHAFCLIEAPDKESVIKMHNQAHGLVPHKIIQVNSNLVAAFLGRIQDPESLDELSKSDIRAFYSDPAFRVILVTDSLDFKLLTFKVGREKAYELVSLQNEIVHQQVKDHEGQEIEMEGNGFVASFLLSSQAVQCALSIQKQLHIAAELLQLRVGVHAGIPVTKSDKLFGEIIRYARHLCMFEQDKQVILSSLVNNLHKKDKGLLAFNSKIRIVTPEEEEFFERLIDSLSDNSNNPDFVISDLCKQLFVSNSKLYRSTISSTGLTPNVLLREYRLIKSLHFLNEGNRSISQAGFDAGFNSPSYFTKCFHKKFNLKPMEYLKQKG